MEMTLGKEFFKSKENLKVLEIGPDVMSINMSLLMRLRLLEAIHVDERNEFYTSEDGVLFTKDKKTLLMFPKKYTRISYTPPEETENIGSNAFSWGRKLVSFYGNSDLKRINRDAFNNCRYLQLVRLEGQVEFASVFAFKNCPDLRAFEVSEDNKHFYVENGKLIRASDGHQYET